MRKLKHYIVYARPTSTGRIVLVFRDEADKTRPAPAGGKYRFRPFASIMAYNKPEAVSKYFEKLIK